MKPCRLLSDHLLVDMPANTNGMKYASLASIFNNDEAKLRFKYTVTCLRPFPSRVPVLISDLRNWNKAGSCAGFGGSVS